MITLEQLKDIIWIGTPSGELFHDVCDELLKYKQLEEEIECSLDVREKAFKYGFYDINGTHYRCEHYVPFLESMHTSGIMNGTSKSFKLKDYKKTWFLKEDKSE